MSGPNRKTAQSAVRAARDARSNGSTGKNTLTTNGAAAERNVSKDALIGRIASMMSGVVVKEHARSSARNAGSDSATSEVAAGMKASGRKEGIEPIVITIATEKGGSRIGVTASATKIAAFRIDGTAQEPNAMKVGADCTFRRGSGHAFMTC